MFKKFLMVAVVLLAPILSVHAACLDHGIWDNILKTNVDADGLVNYEAIRVNKGGDLYEYLSFVDDANLKLCNDSEKLAFWINAYNANVIRLVLARPKLAKIDEDFKLFGEKFEVAGLKLTLNEIEHRVLRSHPGKGGPIEGVSLKEFDPRLHFALVCAAIDCPKLSNRAFKAPQLEAQLQAAAVAFANNPKHLRVENGQLIMSSIMNWYKEDFDKVGGVAAYLTSLMDPAKRADAEEVKAKLATDFPSLVRFRYDWTLNSVKNRK